MSPLVFWIGAEKRATTFCSVTAGEGVMGLPGNKAPAAGWVLAPGGLAPTFYPDQEEAAAVLRAAVSRYGLHVLNHQAVKELLED